MRVFNLMGENNILLFKCKLRKIRNREEKVYKLHTASVNEVEDDEANDIVCYV